MKQHLRHAFDLFMLLLFVCCSYDVFALDPTKSTTQYAHDVWSVDHGLPDNTVRKIVQTKDGYLWLLTDAGLVRFDGVRFTQLNQTDTPELGATLTDIYADRKGRLWIATDRGTVVCRDHEWITYRIPWPIKGGLSLLEDRKGTLWIATYGYGLLQFQHGKWSRYTTADGLAGDKIWSLHEGRDGSLWIATDGNGIGLYRNGQWSSFSTHNGLTSDVVSSVFEDRQGDLWAGIYGGGLNRLHDGTWSAYYDQSDETVWTITQDHDGDLWIGTLGGGLRRYNDRTWDGFSAADGLSSNRVLSIYEDVEGSLWIGTEFGGLNRLRDRAWSAYSTREGLLDNNVISVYQDRNESIWIGTDRGLHRIRERAITPFTTRDGLSSNVVTSILEDKDGVLWIGTVGGGLNLLKDGKWSALTAKTGLLHDIVLALFEDRDGNVWIGTRGGGLIRYREGVLSNYTAGRHLSSNYVRCILQDHEGSLWFGTNGEGINRLQNGKWSHFGINDGLSDDKILSIYEDRHKNLWIGTDGGGLNRYRDGEFSAWTTSSGMVDDSIYGILEDENENLWMSSFKGIFRVSKADLQDVLDRKRNSIFPVVVVPGVKTSGGVQPTCWKGKDGLLWFATTGGTITIDPRRVDHRNKVIPPVVIEEFVVDDQTVQVKDSEILLDPGRKKLIFRYTALSLLEPTKVHFQVKLEGYDSRWIDQRTAREVSYTHLPPGEYVFRVKACNNDGIWNEAGAAIAFHLKPYFYETTWFRALLILLIVSAVFAGHRARTNRLRARQKELTNLVDLRTRKLAESTEALKESEERYRDLVESSEDLIFTHDLEGRVLSANRAMVRKAGFRNSEEVLGRSIREFIVPEYRDQFEGYLKRVVQEGRGSGLMKILTAGGETRILEYNNSLKGEASTSPIVRGRAIDVTERIAAEQALRESENRFRTLFESSIGFICTHDLNGALLAVNPAAALSLGYSPDTMIGRNLADMVPQRLRPLVQDYLDRIQTEDVAEGELILLTASGEERIWEYRNCVYREHGVRAFVIGYAQDITQRKLLEKRKDELVSVVAHELRTPLTSIHGSMQFLSEMFSESLPGKAKTLVEIAGRGTERLIRLINDLLDVDKIESDKVSMKIEQLNLIPLLTESIASLKPLCDSCAVQVHFVEWGSSLWVKADPDMLVQVVVNLLSNAVKYSMPGQQVDVAASTIRGFVRVAISDHGPGIPEEFRDHIFEKFAQADITKGGSGLGLYISRRIVDKLRGRIGFETESGVGTTFYFDLPEG